MPRLLPTAFVTAINSGHLNLGLFVRFDFKSGTTRYWNGYSPITVESQEWIGAGSLASVSPLSEQRELNASGLQFNLNGVSSAIISLIAGELNKGRGRPFMAYLGAMNDSFSAVLSDGGGAAFYQYAGGYIDKTDVVDEGETCTVSISTELEVVRLFRPNHVRWTHEDQLRIFAGDNFFQYTAALAGKEILWGQKNADGPGSPVSGNPGPGTGGTIIVP